MDINQIKDQATQKGLDLLSSIRQSLGLGNTPQPQPVSLQTQSYLNTLNPIKPTFTPIQTQIQTAGQIPSPAPSVIAPTLLPKTEVSQIPTLPSLPQFQPPEPQFNLGTVLAPTLGMKVQSLPTPGYAQNDPVYRLVKDVIGNPASYYKGKIETPLSESWNNVKDLWNNPNQFVEKPVDSLLKSIGVVGTVPYILTESLVIPPYESFKLSLRNAITGQKPTVDELKNLSTNNPGIPLGDALNINADKNPNLYQATRVIDFIPHIVNVEFGGGGTQTLASIKKLGKTSEEINKDINTAKNIEEGIAQFEQKTGEVVTPEVKNIIQEAVKNPNTLIDEAKKVSGEVPKVTNEILPKAITPVEKLGTVIENNPTLQKNIADLTPKLERSFAKGTFALSDKVSKQVKQILKENLDNYTPITMTEEMDKARNVIQNMDYYQALDAINKASNPKDITYLGNALMEKLGQAKDAVKQADVALLISQKATEFGQAIQALSFWSKLSPEGSKLWFAKEVDKYNQLNDLTKGMKGYVELNASDLNAISKQAEKIAGITDPYEKQFQTALMAKIVADKIPSSFGQKLTSYQTIAQLLNGKTISRNLFGNLMFAVSEAVANGLAIPIDILASKLTGQQRQVANLAPKSFAKGFAQGLYKGAREAWYGIKTEGNILKAGEETAGLTNIQPTAFKSKVGQFFLRALQMTNSTVDKAFFEAHAMSTLEGLMNARGLTQPTEDILERAKYLAEYRTFNDQTRLGKGLGGIKRELNKIAGTPDGRYGLGEQVLKYVKVPSSIFMKNIDYTPLNFVRAVMTMAEPLIGKAKGKNIPFNQQEFAYAVSRAMVGSGIWNTGYHLGKLGIITPKTPDNKKIADLQSATGIQQYSINTDALRRYVLSGFNPNMAKAQPGDNLASYDWAQPLSTNMVMGANWSQTEQRKKNSSLQDKLVSAFGTGILSYASGAQALADQPLLTGVKNLFSAKDLFTGLLNIVSGTPASFVPTLFGQMAQYIDGTKRETFSNNPIDTAKNLVLNKIPYLSTQLPAKYDIVGKPMERYTPNNKTMFNVFLNPTVIDQVENNPNLNEVMRLYESTGETSQIPSIVPVTIKVNGIDTKIEGQQKSDYQKELGQKSDEIIKKILSTQEYYQLPDTDKAKVIAGALSDYNSAIKIQMFGDNPKTISNDVQTLLDNNPDNYVFRNVNQRVLAVPGEERKPIIEQLLNVVKGGNNERITQYIRDNKITQSELASVVNKVKQQAIFEKQAPELQKYNGFSNTQLEELKKTNPTLAPEISKYQAITQVSNSIAKSQYAGLNAFTIKKPKKISVSKSKLAGGKKLKLTVPKPKISGLKSLAKGTGNKLKPKLSKSSLAKVTIKKQKPIKLA